MAYICPNIFFSQSLLNINHLVRIKDKYYNKSKTSPYTGSVFKLSSNTWSKIMETNLVDGVIHGSYYEWYDFNKRKKKGSYVNGIADGLFLSWHYNGNQSTEMVFQDGHPVGISYFWNEIGMKTKEVNNETGISTVWDYYENKKIASKSIEHFGRLHGKYTSWYVNGNIMIEGFYNFESKDGIWISYKKNGKKNTEGMYINDKKNGLWITYDNNEMNKIEEIYDNGVLIDRKEYRYYLSGEKFMDITFSDDNNTRLISTYAVDGSTLGQSNYSSGKLYGVSEKWNDSLQIEYTLNFSNDFLNGTGTFLFDNGSKKSEGEFSNGKRINNWVYYNEDGTTKEEKNFLQ